MVGVPRSKGCSLCVKRRVKCDQNHPACGNCLKYGAECPGYDKTRKFVAGKHAVRPRRARGALTTSQGDVDKGSGLLDLSSSSSDPATPPPFVPLTHQQALAKWSPSFRNYGGQEATASRPMGIPGSLKEQCVPFVYNMMGQLFTIHDRNEVVFIAPWFGTILNYLGKAPVLDSALCAYMLQLVGKARRDPADISRSRDIYVQSLGALQRALNHPVAWKSTETLAATMLCSRFELFAGTQDSLTWMLHVSGVSKLIEERGPASFVTPIDLSLLRNARPMISTKAIFACHDCFLNQREWRKVFKGFPPKDVCIDQPLDRSKPGGTVTYASRIDGYFHLHVQLPPVIRAGYNIREGRVLGVEPDPLEVARLRPKAEELLASFILWYDSCDVGSSMQPAEVPSADPTSPYPRVLKWTNPWDGALIMSYWASLLILQECLLQCHSGPDLPLTNKDELANNIMRSLEHVGQGLMGPHRVGLPVRVAYDFVDEATQGWAMSKISRYSDTYAAMSADTYPSNPAFDHLQASQPFSWVD